MKTKDVIPPIKPFSRLSAVLCVFLIFFIFLNLAFVWYNSSEIADDSDKRSESITKSIAPYVTENYNSASEDEKESFVSELNVKVRMYAHSLEFVPLGFLFVLLSAIILDLGRGRVMAVRLAFIFFICMTVSALCALGDEIHQLFVDGRAFELKDIACDTAGAGIGCIFALLVIIIAGLFRCDNAEN